MPKSLQICAASFITSQSEVEPITMPTKVLSAMFNSIEMIKKFRHGDLSSHPCRPLVASIDDLRQLAFLVFLRHLFQRQRLDLRRLTFAAERNKARQANFLGGFARGLQVVARIELARVLGEVTADRASHRQTDIGVDID